jgi:tyrosine-protein phosphatase 2/3
VWQQDVRVIVMLTAEQEGGQIKAHNYWSSRHFGHLKLNFLSEHRASLEPAKIHRRGDGQRPSIGGGRRSTISAANESRKEKGRQSIPGTAMPVTGAGARSKEEEHNPFASASAKHNSSDAIDPFDNATDSNPPPEMGEQPYVTVRKFTLSHSEHPFEPLREITQLQYASWPDFGAPAHPAHLLGLVEQVGSVTRRLGRRGSSITVEETADEEERPVIVHCSAGCGRTGTFCTVDTVLDLLKRQQRKKQMRQVQDKGQKTKQPADVVEKVGKETNKKYAIPMDLDLHESSDQASDNFTGRSPSGSIGGMDALLGRMDVDAGSPSSSSADDKSPMISKMKNFTEDMKLANEEEDLVEKVVEEFRHQRLSMVQSLRQFVLCYETVLEWLVLEELAAKA